MAEEKLTKNSNLLTYAGLFQFVHEAHNKAFDPIDKNAAKAYDMISLFYNLVGIHSCQFCLFPS